jgi:DNA-binding YbaB/EbfC family protein
MTTNESDLPAATLPDLSGLGSGGAMPDLGALLGQAQAMMAASAEAADAVVEGHAAGGLVTVAVNGRFEFSAVHIDPSVIDPADPAMLEDLVLAALHDAAAQVARQQQDLLGGFGMGGLGMSGLGLDDLLGG